MRLVLLILLLVAGCGAIYTSPEDKLQMAVLRYNDAVRWRNVEAASEFIPESRRRAYVELKRRVGQDLTVLDYEIGTVRYPEPNKTAEVLVQFTWNRLPSNVVETTTFKQEWEYGIEKTWWFVKQEPVASPKGPDVKLEDRF